ncbi:MAG: hypothetical protein HYS77_17740 [Candidatus Rokubacteria bacterium]|nr:hypothetical protein [Candidatus Rokubacteria bacterium]
MPKTAGILLIGNEILSGKIADANAAYLCRELRGLGVEVRRISVIPDEVDLIAREVAAQSRDYDVVFTSGGVGPTHDDVTIEGVARAMARDAGGGRAGGGRARPVPDDPRAKRLRPAGRAGDLPPEVRGDPRAVPRPADPFEERVRADRRGDAGRLPQQAPGGLSLAPARLLPGVLQSRVQGEGDARVTGPRAPRGRAGGVPPAAAGRGAREGGVMGGARG